MIDLIDIILFAFLVITALAMLRLHNLFAVVMLASAYSLISAAIFTTLDAVDVAFTEAAVGAGISTVLMLGTMALTTSKEKVVHTKSLVPLLVVLATGAALIWGTLDMPDFGDTSSPVNSRVTERYINESGHAMGIPNIVTSVLASYRGYDTMGETTVIFTAAVSVLILLGRNRFGIGRGNQDRPFPPSRPKSSESAARREKKEDEE